jgi:periplasmic mercuric ion binding protein
MNTILKSCIIALISLFSISEATAQNKNTVTTTFWVAGICGLCEETIEKTMDTKGIVSADYILDTNQLTVTYKPARISEDKIHQLLNDVGYDTARSACTTDQYNRVHECCRYRDQEKH